MSEVALYGDTTMYQDDLQDFQALALGEPVYMQYASAFRIKKLELILVYVTRSWAQLKQYRKPVYLTQKDNLSRKEGCKTVKGRTFF